MAKPVTVDHHNRVVRAGTKRALALEPKLVKILTPILDRAAKSAASAFEAKATGFLAAAAYRRADEARLLCVAPTDVRSLLASLVLTASVAPNSTMVALKPRPEEALLLAQDGGHAPDDLHVTLALLGRYDGDLDALAALLAPVAAGHAPLEGKVAGLGAFEAKGAAAPAIYLPSVPGLVELRVAVTEALAQADQDYNREYGYVPHMTTDYGDTLPAPEGLGVPLHFDALLIVRGNTEVVALPFVGPPPITAAAGESGSTTRSLQDAFDAVDAATRDLASAVHDGDQRDIEKAKAKLTAAEKDLTRRLSGREAKKAKKPTPPGDAEVPEPTPEPPPPPGPPVREATEVGKAVATKGAEEARIEGEVASQIEAIAQTHGADVAKGLARVAARPFGGDPEWVGPLADEIVNVAFLVDQLRTKTDPVRQAVVENVMQASVEGAGIDFDLTNPFAAKVLAQSGSQITNIAMTTQINVMRIIQASYDEGLSIPDTAKAIRAGMADANKARATLIARTELAGAVNGASLAGTQIVQSALGETYYKQWLTAPGAPNPRHEDYDGLDEQTQALDDDFDVGGSGLQYPGDPDGPVEEVANCRCALVYISAEDAAAQGVELGGDSTAPEPMQPPEIARPLMQPPGAVPLSDDPDLPPEGAFRALKDDLEARSWRDLGIAKGAVESWQRTERSWKVNEVMRGEREAETGKRFAGGGRYWGDQEIADELLSGVEKAAPFREDFSAYIGGRTELAPNAGFTSVSFSRAAASQFGDVREVIVPAGTRGVWIGGTEKELLLEPRVALRIPSRVVTDDPTVAAQALWAGQKVVLNQPTQIATLIDDLGAMAKDAQEKGIAAPPLNLGAVTVPGTNLFTQDTIGAPRVEMPQLKGVPVPGSLADAMARDKRGEVDIAPLFYKHLQDEGIGIEYNQSVRVDQLRATQTELDGAKVAGIMDYLEGGGKIEGSIPVTKDGYVIDGHHRWAAEIGLDYKSAVDKPWLIQADVVDKDVTSIINEANLFAADYGIPQSSAFVKFVGEAKAETTLGITPFRVGDEAVSFYDTLKAKQFEADLEPTAKQFGVSISKNERVTGVWQGAQEPSYALTAHDGPDGVAKFAATMRAKYDQDGVLLFSPDPVGESYSYTLHRVDPDAVISKLGDYGIDGATATADTVVIVGDHTIADNVAKLASEAKSVVTVRRGALSFVERGEVPRSVPEIHALHPGVEMALSERPEGLVVSMIRVPVDTQGKGEAAAAMTDILRYADRNALAVALTPDAVGGGMSTTQLRLWYKRLGFVPNKGRGADFRFTESMIRRPVEGAPLPDFDAYSEYVNSFLNRTDSMILAAKTNADGALTADEAKKAVARLKEDKKDLLELRDHPDPKTALSAARTEQLGLQVKVDDGTATAEERARFDKLDEQIKHLAHLRSSRAYAALEEARRIVADAAKQKEIVARQEKSLREAVARGEQLKAEQVSSIYAMRAALADKADDEWVNIPPRTIHWSKEGDYQADRGAAWRHNGVLFTAETGSPFLDDPAALAAQVVPEYQKKVEPWIDSLPPEIRGRLDRVNIFTGVDPDEAYWAGTYGQAGSILASTGQGEMTFWQAAKLPDALTRGTLEHESGHLIFPGGGPKLEEAWIQAANKDADEAVRRFGLNRGDALAGTTPGSFRGFLLGIRGVSDYGTSDIAEDWAESIRLYLRDRREGSIGTLEAKLIPHHVSESGREAVAPRTIRFAEAYPNRAKLIEKWMKLPPVEAAADTTPGRPLFAPKVPLSAPSAKEMLARHGRFEDYKPEDPTSGVHAEWEKEQAKAKSVITEGLDEKKITLDTTDAASVAKQEVTAALTPRLADDPAWRMATSNQPVRTTFAALDTGDVFRDWRGGGGVYRLMRRGEGLEPHSVEILDPGTDAWNGHIGDVVRVHFGRLAPVEVIKGERHPIPVDFKSPVSGLVSNWATTAADNSPWSLALQRAVNDEFGLGAEPLKVFAGRSAETMKDVDAIYAEKGPALRAFVRAQYDETQKLLRERGVREVTLYRGVGGAKGAPGPTPAEKVRLQPASAFSASYATATMFTAQDPAIISVTVPAERVLATPRSGWGSLKEQEYVVLAPAEGVTDEAAVLRQTDSWKMPPNPDGFWEQIAGGSPASEFTKWQQVGASYEARSFAPEEYVQFGSAAAAEKATFISHGSPIFKVKDKVTGPDGDVGVRLEVVQSRGSDASVGDFFVVSGHAGLHAATPLESVAP